MNWHIRFKPKPRYLRDRLELWIIRISDGWTLRYNLSGLFPFIGIPIGALFGAIVSFVIDFCRREKLSEPSLQFLIVIENHRRTSRIAT